MASRRVCVIGGGPAGLFTARLLALRNPDWEIRVYERLPPEDTFGFGVGLTGGLVRALQEADPQLLASIDEAAFEFSGAEFRLPQGRAELPRFHAGALGRALLLRLLTAHALEAGVEIEQAEAPPLERLAAEADLVIAADGVSSLVRERNAERLGAEESVGRGLFIWCGSEAPMAGTAFFPARTEAGLFLAHAYPYAESRSTYVIEADGQTLAKAGCWTTEFDADGDSDEAALEYLSAAFAELLEGGSFLGNRSRWMRFRTVRCRRWHFGNVVLLGDAKATAHPSIGSGTKLALEDGIALAAAMDLLGDEPPASRLERFEQARRPDVERLQERAVDSQLWWESIAIRIDSSPARLAAAYLSRAGAVSLEDLAAAGESLAAEAVAQFAGVEPGEVPASGLSDWVLRQPLSAFGVDLPNRLLDPGADEVGGLPVARLGVDFKDAWGEAAADAARAAGVLVRAGARVVLLTGGATRLELIDRLAFGERLRNELDALVAVLAPADLADDLADGIVASRADLAALV